MGPLRPHFCLPMNAVTPMTPHLSATDARGFGHVDTWIFDLDNTLYPHDARVWPQVDERITLFIADLYGLDGISARALQKYFYHRYGTTLKGLMEEEGINPYDFLDFAHDIDHSGIELNPLLGAAIERLPGRKLILTNGSKKHAESVAMKLGIYDHFEDVFDIVAAITCRSRTGALTRGFSTGTWSIRPRRRCSRTSPATSSCRTTLGMTTVLIIPQTIDPFRETFEQEAVEAPHIDHITNDLAGFSSASASRSRDRPNVGEVSPTN